MNSIFYIVACAAALDGGIYRYQMMEDGSVRQLGFNQLDNANWISFSPDRRFLYSTCTVGDSSGVAAYKVGADGALTELNRMSAASGVRQVGKDRLSPERAGQHRDFSGLFGRPVREA